MLGDENVAKYLRSDDFREGLVLVETAMCNDFQGWGNFSRNEFGIDSNVCKQHATGNVLYSLSCRVLPPTQWPAGISAFHYPNLKYFPSVDAYNDYYKIVVEIGVETFATRCQELLGDYLRTNYGDEVANWCREFGQSPREECVLRIAGMLGATTTWVSVRYAGCYNNIPLGSSTSRYCSTTC